MCWTFLNPAQGTPTSQLAKAVILEVQVIESLQLHDISIVALDKYVIRVFLRKEHASRELDFMDSF